MRTKNGDRFASQYIALVRGFSRERAILLGLGRQWLDGSSSRLRLPHRDDLANHRDELRHVERLFDHGMHLVSLQLCHSRIIERGHDENHGSRLRSCAVKRLQKLEAVETRHHEVENDDGVFEVARHLKRGRAIGRGVYVEWFTA